MDFITNRIMNPSGNGISFDEWVRKTFASEAKPECGDDPRGQCRGQVINNDNEEGADSYQKGESVDGKPDQAEGKSKKKEDKKEASAKQAHCDKEMGESGKAGDVTEEHSDAANADVGKASVKQKINNDPNYQKGESVDPAKSTGKNKKDSNDKVVGKPSKKSQSNKYSKVASLSRPDKIKLFAALTSTKTNPFNYVEAMVGIRFANMTDDEKNYLRKFWNVLYPREYVEEMVADR